MPRTLTRGEGHREGGRRDVDVRGWKWRDTDTRGRPRPRRTQKDTAVRGGGTRRDTETRGGWRWVDTDTRGGTRARGGPGDSGVGTGHSRGRQTQVRGGTQTPGGGHDTEVTYRDRPRGMQTWGPRGWGHQPCPGTRPHTHAHPAQSPGGPSPSGGGGQGGSSHGGPQAEPPQRPRPPGGPDPAHTPSLRPSYPQTPAMLQPASPSTAIVHACACVCMRPCTYVRGTARVCMLPVGTCTHTCARKRRWGVRVSPPHMGTYMHVQACGSTRMCAPTRVSTRVPGGSTGSAGSGAPRAPGPGSRSRCRHAMLWGCSASVQPPPSPETPPPDPHRPPGMEQHPMSEPCGTPGKGHGGVQWRPWGAQPWVLPPLSRPPPRDWLRPGRVTGDGGTRLFLFPCLRQAERQPERRRVGVLGVGWGGTKKHPPGPPGVAPPGERGSGVGARLGCTGLHWEGERQHPRGMGGGGGCSG